MDNEKVQKQIQKKAQNKAKSKAKRTVKKKAKRISPLSYVIWLLVLAIGLAVGAGACAFLCRNDGFEVLGKKEQHLPILGEGEGEVYEFTDKGVKIVSFGRDISDRVKVRTNMTEVDAEEGKYAFDGTKEGVYYLIYTVDDPRFGEIQRVRTFFVGGEG